jgi:hypothetical protein
MGRKNHANHIGYPVVSSQFRDHVNGPGVEG